MSTVTALLAGIKEQSNFEAANAAEAMLQQNNTRLVAAIEGVVGLHKPVLPVDEPLLSMTICDECERLYPCPTITAVVAALGGGE